jgi:hypothetical protein
MHSLRKHNEDNTCPLPRLDYYNGPTCNQLKTPAKPRDTFVEHASHTYGQQCYQSNQDKQSTRSSSQQSSQTPRQRRDAKRSREILVAPAFVHHRIDIRLILQLAVGRFRRFDFYIPVLAATESRESKCDVSILVPID